MKKLTILLFLCLMLDQVNAAITASTYPVTENNSSSLLVASGTRTQRLSPSAENPSNSISLPFNFVFDGTTYSNIYVGEHGWIKLGGSERPNTKNSNDLASNNDIPKIAPFWDEVNFASSSNNGGAYTFVNGAAPNRIFVTEWIVKVPKDGSAVGKFQVALYETSNNIAFFYQGMNPTGSMYSSYSIGLGNKFASANNFVSVTVGTTTSIVSYSNSNNSNSVKIPDTKSYLFTSTASSSFSASSNLNFTNLATSSITVNFTAGSGSNHFVLCKAGSAITDAPINNTSYTSNATYGTSGSALGASYIVYNGTGSSVTVTGLTANTVYYFKVIEQFGTGGNATFNTSTFLSGSQASLAPAPTPIPVVTPPSVGSKNSNSCSFSVTPGNGSRRVVLCHKDNESNYDCVNGRQYSANSEYGKGDACDGGYVVYDGTGSTFNISNLESAKKYHFTVIEYNGSGSSCSYNNSQKNRCNSTTNATPPTVSAGSGTFGTILSNEVVLSFTKGNGAKRLVLCKKGSEANDDCQDGRKYQADSNFGLGDLIGSCRVVYNGSGNSCRIKNLEPNCTYHFSVIEYNGDDTECSYDNSHKYKCSASTPKTDTDNDGVPDDEDEFPADQHKAYTVNYPSAGFGTLMYEDLWPGKGDYDFNDLVVDYRYTTVTNAQNNVVEVQYTFVTRAIGGALHNGFAFQLDGINPNKITSITGSKASGASWITLNANGTEAGQTNANILVLDDAYELYTLPGGYSFVNTDPNAPNLGTDTTRMTVKFLNNGVAPAGGTLSGSVLTNSVFNPYLIVGQDRGKEVHLINRTPTAKVNSTYFGTIDDRSAPSSGKYYSTENNLPWALNVVNSIPYVTERTDFSHAYLKFIEWAQSGGTTSTNWYQDLTGYRNKSKMIIR